MIALAAVGKAHEIINFVRVGILGLCILQNTQGIFMVLSLYKSINFF